MQLTTNVHTILMLIGSTNYGKTTFAKEILNSQLHFCDEEKGFTTNVQYISSDEIRFFEKLNEVTSFPINAEFVIVDTIAFTEEFREQITKIAKTNHYNLEVVLFDNKDREDHSKYKRVHRIKEKNFYDPVRKRANPDYKVIVEDLHEYMNCVLPRAYKYIVVGDVHEKVRELKQLLISHGFEIQGNRIVANEKMEQYRVILVGDWIDKGGATKDIVEFIGDNLRWFILVKGNHENFVYKYLHGQIDKRTVDQNLLTRYFDSVQIFERDEELKQKFFRLVEVSKEFYRYIGLHIPSFYVTHAPCEKKYIGKLDRTSTRKQRSFLLNREKSHEEQLGFLELESEENHPYHIFGHVAVEEIVRFKNKINIDTGSVNGNLLSSVVFDSGEPFFKQQKALS